MGKGNIDTRQTANDLNNCSDVEFAEFFVYLDKIRRKRLPIIDQNELDKITLSAEDMRNFSAKELTDWLCSCLDEIIDSPEIDASAWWKEQEDNDVIKVIVEV